MAQSVCRFGLPYSDLEKQEILELVLAHSHDPKPNSGHNGYTFFKVVKLYSRIIFRTE